LIDPVRYSDVRLLDFGVDGKARPRPEFQIDSEFWTRAYESTTILHLNEGRLKRLRRQCYKQVVELIQRVDAAYIDLRAAREAACPTNILAALERAGGEAIESLYRRTLPGSDFIGTARAALRAYATPEREWIEELLKAA
jgi:hypothetical protein